MLIIKTKYHMAVRPDFFPPCCHCYIIQESKSKILLWSFLAPVPFL